MTILTKKFFPKFFKAKQVKKFLWFQRIFRNSFKKFNYFKTNFFKILSRGLKNFPIRPPKFVKPLVLLIFRHSGIIVLALFILAGNLLASRTMAIEADFGTVISISESVAVTEKDLIISLDTIGQFTPYLSENPKLAANQLMAKEVLVMVDGDYLAKPSVLGLKSSAQSFQKTNSSERKGIIIYTVKNGDTISKIANKFSISLATIKTSNRLGSDIIKPGQKLHIPSANGLIHTVSRGETLIGIVAYYSGDLDKTITKNNFGKNFIIYAGQKILVVNGRVPASTRLASRQNSDYSAGSGSGAAVRGGSCANRFSFGWCTWYVASRRCIPWTGNARAWPYQARRSGYQVGRTPVAGAIMVTNESWWGHVAFVESVNGNSVTISEMNFIRWGRVNRRTLSASYGVYIY